MVMTLEWRIRRLQEDWNHHSNRSLRAVSPLATVYNIFTTAGDEGREATVAELRVVEKRLDELDRMLDERVHALISMKEQVFEFAEAVNDALADAEPSPAAQPVVGTTGIDDEVVDRLAAFYTQRGHDIR